MDNNPFVKGLKNASIGVKRAVERMSVDVMGSVGLSSSALPENFAQYDHTSTAYFAQSDSLKSLRGDAFDAFDAIVRSTGAAHALAARLSNTLAKGAGSDGPRLAADALLTAQSAIADEVLSRVERRVKKRVIAPADEELDRTREVAARVQIRKKVLLDAQRYRARVNDTSADNEDERKAREKAAELVQITDELVAIMSAALPRRAALVERAVAETIEFQRRFYLDSARLLERSVEAVGQDRLASIRASGEEQDTARGNPISSADIDDDLLTSARPQRRPSQQPKPLPTQPKSSNGTSLWDEDEEDDDTADHVMRPSPENPFEHDAAFAAKFDVPQPRGRRDVPASSGGTGYSARESQAAYPSAGIGKRESVGGYPSAGVGSRESVSSYPTGGSRQRESVYPGKSTSRSRPPSAPPANNANASTSKPPTRETAYVASSGKPSRRNRSDTESDLLNFDEADTTSRSSRSRKASPPPAAAGVEDLLDLGSSNNKRNISRSTSSSAMEGDLLGDFANVSSAPTRSRSTNPSRSRNPPPSVATSSSAPSMAGTFARTSPSASTDAGSTATCTGGLEREQLRRKHEAEIKARADEKLAAVRERERAEEKERDQKDNARGAAEAKVNQWTGNGTRRGNLRALLASLDTVLYAGATWKPVTMDSLKANSKVKIHYHKAILQVHPDKIGSKNLTADQQVLAELIFDELKNGYEVWTAEQEGRAPPPGSVGPKGAANMGGAPGGFGGMGGMGRPGMYNNMGGMGRGGMGMGGMGGMNRNGMGNMGGMGGMGRGGMGMAGMAGRGMGGMGMGGMGGMGMGGMGTAYGPQAGRRGTGMGNMPQGYGNGRNTQQRR